MTLELKMRPALELLGAAALLAVAVSGCETKVTQVSVVCRAGEKLTTPVRWIYTDKVDPSVIRQIPRAIDITLHNTGAGPRAVPPITTYFYRQDGAALRVASSVNAAMPANGTFTYHVDPGGYDKALRTTGHGPNDALAFIIVADGNYFAGLMSPPTCGRWGDGHLDISNALEVPNLNDRRPLNMAASEWLEVSSLPTVVKRTQGQEVSTYAFFTAPITLTATRNATSAPDDPDMQLAEIGVTAATPTYAIYAIVADPAPNSGLASGPWRRATSEGESVFLSKANP
jgi:hypothetical protein